MVDPPEQLTLLKIRAENRYDFEQIGFSWIIDISSHDVHIKFTKNFKYSLDR